MAARLRATADDGDGSASDRRAVLEQSHRLLTGTTFGDSSDSKPAPARIVVSEHAPAGSALVTSRHPDHSSEYRVLPVDLPRRRSRPRRVSFAESLRPNLNAGPLASSGLVVFEPSRPDKHRAR